MNEHRKPSAAIRWRLAVNVARLREARGYTQKQLGERCGLTRNYISNIEQDTVNIGLANLEALAVGLECLETDLLMAIGATQQRGEPPVTEHRKPSTKILSQLATNVRRLRRARGYTQQQLAHLCQFEPSYIGDIEQETVNVTLANLEALSKGLGCSADALLLPVEELGSDPEDFVHAIQSARNR